MERQTDSPIPPKGKWFPRDDRPSTENIEILIDVLLAILTERVKGKEFYLVPIMRTLAQEVSES